MQTRMSDTHLHCNSIPSTTPGCPIPPNFLWSLVGSAHLMRLSLKKGAHAVLSRAAYRKFGASRSFFARCGIPRTSTLFHLPGLTSNSLASLAREALIAEAELTPKPGLVDRRGSGGHHDLSLALMRQSAIAIEPYFAAMASCSQGKDIDCNLRSQLAAIGRNAERAMYQATQGSNSHKGAIWILGLLVAAAIRVPSENAREIAETAGAIARIPDRAQPKLITHGDVVRNRYGAGGARWEASRNFPHVIHCGLPMLRDRRAEIFPEEVCRLDTLLSLMAKLDDTCVLYRGGVEASCVVKAGARAVLDAGGYSSAKGRQRMRELDRELIARHVSPGGSADLLAATIFLDAMEYRQGEVLQDQSKAEERDGAA
jgi:triphosphoribosyl-dephospho-CoA synthase